MPRYLDKRLAGDLATAVPAVQQETARHLRAGAVFLDIARGARHAPSDPGEHYMATDILNRDIRAYSAGLFHDNMPVEQSDLVASMIEEADFSASLAESLHQIARRVRRQKFGEPGQKFLDEALTRLNHSLRVILPDDGFPQATLPLGHAKITPIEDIRWRLLQQGPNVPSDERGALLALFGSVERAELLINRIDAERKSVDRGKVGARAEMPSKPQGKGRDLGGLSPVPAE
jgi:phosphate:Na+ symporter